jgi:hypothetical protein
MSKILTIFFVPEADIDRLKEIVNEYPGAECLYARPYLNPDKTPLTVAGERLQEVGLELPDETAGFYLGCNIGAARRDRKLREIGGGMPIDQVLKLLEFAYSRRPESVRSGPTDRPACKLILNEFLEDKN